MPWTGSQTRANNFQTRSGRVSFPSDIRIIIRYSDVQLTPVFFAVVSSRQEPDFSGKNRGREILIRFLIATDDPEKNFQREFSEEPKNSHPVW
jgi:hypothetical protein